MLSWNLSAALKSLSCWVTYGKRCMQCVRADEVLITIRRPRLNRVFDRRSTSYRWLSPTRSRLITTKLAQLVPLLTAKFIQSSHNNTQATVDTLPAMQHNKKKIYNTSNVTRISKLLAYKWAVLNITCKLWKFKVLWQTLASTMQQFHANEEICKLQAVLHNN